MLCAKDLLTDEECEMLGKCESYIDQNTNFYEILSSKLKETESYLTFREALRATGQEHVDNLLEGMVPPNSTLLQPSYSDQRLQSRGC